MRDPSFLLLSLFKMIVPMCAALRDLAGLQPSVLRTTGDDTSVRRHAASPIDWTRRFAASCCGKSPYQKKMDCPLHLLCGTPRVQSIGLGGLRRPAAVNARTRIKHTPRRHPSTGTRRVQSIGLGGLGRSAAANARTRIKRPPHRPRPLARGESNRLDSAVCGVPLRQTPVPERNPLYAPPGQQIF